MKSVALGVRFLLELCILASFAAWAARLDTPAVARVVLGVILCLDAATAWGLLLSPKRRFDLPAPVRLAIEAGFFGLAAAALFEIGWTMLALALLLAAIAHRIALAIFR